MKCDKCNRRPSFYYKFKDDVNFYCVFCVPKYGDYEAYEDPDAYLQLYEKEYLLESGPRIESGPELGTESGPESDSSSVAALADLDVEYDFDVDNFYNQLNLYDACVYDKWDLFVKMVPKNNTSNLLMGLCLSCKYENIKICNYLVNYLKDDIDWENLHGWIPNTRLMKLWYQMVSARYR